MSLTWTDLQRNALEFQTSCRPKRRQSTSRRHCSRRRRHRQRRSRRLTFRRQLQSTSLLS
jgi:hypothetical protein